MFLQNEVKIGNSLFNGMDASASGLTAERLRIDVIAGNIANVDTTRTPEGGPFKRQLVVFASKNEFDARKFPFLPMKIKTQMNNPGQGVRVTELMRDPSPPRLKYDPGHPDANNEGYVAYPNIDVIKEMVDMITASRAYEANIQAMNSAKNIAMKALAIGR
jgi:flagellar basal-body rod protein FlgC